MVLDNERQRNPRQVGVKGGMVKQAVLSHGDQALASPLLMAASLPPSHDRSSGGSQRTVSPNSLPPRRPLSTPVISALGCQHMAYAMIVASSSSLVLRMGGSGFATTFFASGAFGFGAFFLADVLNRSWYAPNQNKIPAMAAYRTAGFQLGRMLGVLLGASCLLAPLSGALLVTLPAVTVALVSEVFIRRGLK